MFSRLFGKRKREDEQYYYLPVPENADWSILGADMHSHFLPGIDDGAQSIEDSIILLRGMADMGYKSIITTPHVMIDHYPNTTQTITAALEKVQAALVENNIDLTLKAAAEYYMDEYFMELIDKEPLLTVHNNEVLMEFSMIYEPPMIKEVVFRLQAAGYKPIIAHPERYLFFHHDMDRYQDLKDRGCLLQLNMLALTGYYGQHIKGVADQLLASGMYDYCGSDMHHEKHAAALKAMGQSKLYHKIAGHPFLNSKLAP